jgi:hypothetical protein
VVKERSFDGKISKSLQNCEKEKKMSAAQVLSTTRLMNVSFKTWLSGGSLRQMAQASGECPDSES